MKTALFLFFFMMTNMIQAQESGTVASPKISNVSADEDPYLWLEDVTGEKALDWVRSKNAVTQGKFDSDPRFAKLRDDLLAILDSKERIPLVVKHGNYFYNFWRDQKNERGIWRRTTIDEYKKKEPKWDTILDLDAVAAAEKENWVFAGATVLRPDYKRALISMSRGGADATVTREFDLEKRQFIPDGFNRPESKGGMGWIDENNVYVFTDFGPGTMTSSGYPRIVKQWTRGTNMSQATIVYEGTSGDMSIRAVHDDAPGYERDFVSRNLAFYNDELYLRSKDGLTKLDLPNSANKDVFRQYLTVELREPWEVGDKSFPAGSLLVIKFDDFMRGSRKFEALFTPTANSSLASHGGTRDFLFLNVLEDVKNRIYVMQETAKGWEKKPLEGAPSFGTVTLTPVDPDESNAYFMTATDYITPTTLFYGDIGGRPEKIKELPAFYDATGLGISQHFATSQDGTKVPYFMVAKKGLVLDGSHPTLLYGYGGFEISLTPNYSAGVGRAWTSQGGVYVVANIRGGGEYGPRWHQSALKANRLRAYEDFAAVAQDLVARKVTSKKKLGIQGGSNGGLLVGNMVTLYPELFSAAVCQVPLLDMKRYHLLLAGASWMAEYGNPDAPSEWDFIKSYSPYQNVKKGIDYPSVLFTTSTRDDRVHPGHARKMMARMEAHGYPVMYYENIEGGHGGAANNKQAAYMQALAYSYLRDKLFSAESNPLMKTSSLPFEAPDFSKIKHEHYVPAYEAGMQEQLKECEIIASSNEPPTFQNTIEALEKTGVLLARVENVFSNMTSAHTDNVLQKIEADMAPKLASHSDNILLNRKLFDRVKSIHESRDQLALDGEQKQLLKEYFERFIRAGANLDHQSQARIRQINEELSTLMTKFQENLLAITKQIAVSVDRKEDLDGMSDGDIAACAAAAKERGWDGKYLIAITNTTRQPALTSLKNRAIRERVWKASANRGLGADGSLDNRPLVLQMAKLRAEKAKILGYSSHAAYALQNQMAKEPKAAFDMLTNLVPTVVAKAKLESQEIQALMKREGADFELMPWDWEYYAEKVRKAKYEVDENQVKPYFELENVLQNGVFYTMNRLYGVKFRERHDLPVYCEGVRVFDVMDGGDQPLGLFYADYYHRESKRGGAWMSAFVNQSGLRNEKPVVINVMNIPKPAAGEPTLLTFDLATTMFHEMGHALHGLFSKVKYPALAGTNVPRDFVEFPSTFHEDFAILPEVLNQYAKHYKTGETIPPDLLKKVLEANKFNEGFDTLEYLSAALLDLAWHSTSPSESPTDMESFEAATLKKYGVDVSAVPPRYRSAYFAHIWPGGYSASYYAYLWSEVLAADAYAHMRNMGGMKSDGGKKFRDAILAVGGSREPMQSYIDFRGKEPSVDGLLIRRGLKEAPKP